MVSEWFNLKNNFYKEFKKKKIFSSTQLGNT